MDTFLAGFANDPIGMFEIRLVGRGEVARGQEWPLPITVDRPFELVLDQIDDDRIETFAAAVFQVQFGFVLGEAHDERPWRVALNQKRLAALIDHVAVIRPEANRIRTRGYCQRRAGQRAA